MGIATPVCGLVRNDRYGAFGLRKIRGIATPVCGLVRNDRCAAFGPATLSKQERAWGRFPLVLKKPYIPPYMLNMGRYTPSSSRTVMTARPMVMAGSSMARRRLVRTSTSLL